MPRTAGRSRDDDLDDFEERPGVTPAHWLLLALGAAWRRKLVALLVFAAGAAAITAYYRLRTPTYRVETQILAQRQNALPSFARSVYEETPTRSAWETVHRRENLLALVAQTRLLASARTRAHAERDGQGPAASADPAEALVQLLDRRLLVETDGATITISFDWTDPQVAYEVVQAALNNFLEARHVQEITAIDEVISVLQGRASALRAALDGAIDDARRRASPARVVVPRPRGPSEELVRLQSLVEAKQRAVRDVEEIRLRRLADLQAQLDQARNTLSDRHPTIIGLRKDLEAASRESPQIEALREEERQLRKEYSDRLAREGFAGTPAAAAAAQAPAPAAATLDDDPNVRQARMQYEQIAARVSSAQIELDAARAAFKYRYAVIWPPQRPSEPVSPNPRKIFGAGLLAALLLALGVAAAPDVLSGRIVQRWQVERQLGLDVLGELERRG